MTKDPGLQIYHITHLRNLPRIAAAGVLWSDAKRIELSVDSEVIGMSSIKRRRLEQLEVSCHSGTKVGRWPSSRGGTIEAVKGGKR
jgi:hypothetical protein